MLLVFCNKNTQLVLFTLKIDVVTRCCAETVFMMHNLDFSMVVPDYFMLYEQDKWLVLLKAVSWVHFY